MSFKCGLGYFRGVAYNSKKDVLEGFKGNMRCKSWQCLECRELKHKELFARVINGNAVIEAQRPGFRPRYNIKLLTLTFPGRAWRSVMEREEAYEIMAECFNKLIRAMKKKLGEFSYLRVLEDQQDGYPHFHVLLVGPAIAPKWVLRYIHTLWCDTYHMGFVKLNASRSSQSVQGAIGYILKYLKKNPAYYEHKPVYTASHQMLQKRPEKGRVWLQYKIERGVFQEEQEEWEYGELREEDVTPEVWLAFKAKFMTPF
jgi:hypothetical protein